MFMTRQSRKWLSEIPGFISQTYFGRPCTMRRTRCSLVSCRAYSPGMSRGMIQRSGSEKAGTGGWGLGTGEGSGFAALS